MDITQGTIIVVVPSSDEPMMPHNDVPATIDPPHEESVENDQVSPTSTEAVGTLNGME